MADRKRLWMPFRMGVPTNLAVATVLRIDLTSIANATLGREVEGYTTQRAIFDVAMINTGSAVSQIAMGIINFPTNMFLGNSDPVTDPMADWQWWEEIMTESSGNTRMHYIHRDIATVRRSPGRERNLWMYIQNSGAQPCTVYAAGRILVLE